MAAIGFFAMAEVFHMEPVNKMASVQTGVQKKQAPPKRAKSPAIKIRRKRGKIK